MNKTNSTQRFNMETIENMDFNREDSDDKMKNEQLSDMLQNQDYLKKDNIYRNQYQQQPIQYNYNDNQYNKMDYQQNQKYNQFDQEQQQKLIKQQIYSNPQQNNPQQNHPQQNHPQQNNNHYPQQQNNNHYPQQQNNNHHHLQQQNKQIYTSQTLNNQIPFDRQYSTGSMNREQPTFGNIESNRQYNNIDNNPPLPQQNEMQIQQQQQYQNKYLEQYNHLLTQDQQQEQKNESQRVIFSQSKPIDGLQQRSRQHSTKNSMISQSPMQTKNSVQLTSGLPKQSVISVSQGGISIQHVEAMINEKNQKLKIEIMNDQKNELSKMYEAICENQKNQVQSYKDTTNLIAQKMQQEIQEVRNMTYNQQTQIESLKALELKISAIEQSIRNNANAISAVQQGNSYSNNIHNPIDNDLRQQMNQLINDVETLKQSKINDEQIFKSMMSNQENFQKYLSQLQELILQKEELLNQKIDQKVNNQSQQQDYNHNHNYNGQFSQQNQNNYQMNKQNDNNEPLMRYAVSQYTDDMEYNYKPQ